MLARSHILFLCHYYCYNLLIVVKSYNIIINKPSELHRHPILFLPFFSIPTFFHFLNFLFVWFISFFITFYFTYSFLLGELIFINKSHQSSLINHHNKAIHIKRNEHIYYLYFHHDTHSPIVAMQLK